MSILHRCNSLLAALGRWIQEWATQGDRITVRTTLVDPLTALSGDNVFEFQAHVTFNWTASGLSRKKLLAAARHCEGKVRNRVNRRLARLAHLHHGQDVRRFELRLGSELAADPVSYLWRGHEITCHASVRITPDEMIRNELRPVLLEQIVLKRKHQTGMLQADLTQALTERWSELLGKLQDDPLAGHAAKLTEIDFARVIGEMATTRDGELTDLLELLDKAMNDFEGLQLGGYEWAETYKKSVQAVMRRHNVPDTAPASELG